MPLEQNSATIKDEIIFNMMWLNYQASSQMSTIDFARFVQTF